MRICWPKLVCSLAAVTTYLLAGVFVFSGLTKLLFPDDFLNFSFSVFPLAFVDRTVLISIVVGSELVLSVLLSLNRTRYEGLVLAMVVLTAFTFVLVYSQYLNVEMDCGCFGGLSFAVSNELGILRNILLFMMTGFALSCPVGYSQTDRK